MKDRIEERLENIGINLEENLQVDREQKDKIYQEYLNKNEKKKFNFKLNLRWMIPALSCLIIVAVFGISYGAIYGNRTPKNSSSDLGDLGSDSKLIESIDGVINKYRTFESSTLDDPSGDGETVKSNNVGGILSASAYNDNDHYAFWKKLNDQSDEGALFYNMNKNYGVNTLNRVKVMLPKGLTATVDLLDNNNQVLSTSCPDANGICYLFPKTKQETYNIKVNYRLNNQLVEAVCQTSGELDLTDLVGDNRQKEVLEICFVIDATGSMSDEMSFLVQELKAFQELKDKLLEQTSKEVEVKVAIVVYRDEGDDYVVKSLDFTNIKSASDYLDAQEADGGGDIPEAVHTAFKEALSLNWSKEDTTKIVVHVADASAHEENIGELFKYVNAMAKMGIQIISLECSSSDLTSEYELRMESMLTNGIYCYLTDDSGIGNEHSTPRVEGDVVVEKANQMLIRVIVGLYTGEFAEPVPYQSKIQ